MEIAERCNVEIELGGQLIPSFPTPDGADERTYLRALVDEGLRRRYGDPIPAAARERADYELGVIDRMGFNAYFLIVWDFVKLRQERRDRRRPRPRLGRGLDRRLLRWRSPTSTRCVRPAVRAVPQPRARVDARYRHGLLGARP